MRPRPDSPLAEPSPGINDYRAALMSVALATDPRGDPSLLLDPALRPIPLQEATQTIQSLPGPYRPIAENQAIARLSAATYIDRRLEFRSNLVELAGQARVQSIENELQIDPRKPTNRVPTSHELMRAISPAPRTAALRPSPPRPSPQPVEFPESRLDLKTLATTVHIPSRSNLPFSQLASSLDPRNWSVSPFWPECYQVEFDPTQREFRRLPPTPETPPLGAKWEGYLYEHVEWNWNRSTVSSFRSILNIHFDVDAGKQTFVLTFSLYSCEGSQLYAMQLRRGVDIDRGFQRVSLVPDADEPDTFELETQKVIRFSDILNRRTPLESATPGSGQILSYLAPAIVGLWMQDLIEHLHT